MYIRSLLLGSAAAMVASTAAQAADAIVVEPEPVEYVRVCDAYGAGFFFIPGTETCIRFSGFVRSSYEKTYIDVGRDQAGVQVEASAGRENVNFWGQRARLNIDTRNETDWGTLRAIYRLEGGDSNSDADVDMDVALITLAGFRAGFTGANYWSSNHGFAGVNLTGLGATIGAAQDDGYYGFNDGTIFDYTYAADGFSVTVGVEDTRIDYAGLRGTTAAANGNGFVAGTPGAAGGAGVGDVLSGAAGAPLAGLANAGDPFAGNANGYANFYAGFNYSADFGSIAFTAVRDSESLDSLQLVNGVVDRGAWAYKVSLSLDLSEFIPGGVLYGSYMNDGDAITNYVHVNGNGGIDNAEEIYNIAFQANLTDELEFVARYSNAQGGSYGAAAAAAGLAVGTAGTALGGLEEEQESFTVGLNWFPAAAPGFSIRGSYTFGSVDNPVNAIRTNATGVAGASYDFDGFFIGVRRDF